MDGWTDGTEREREARKRGGWMDRLMDGWIWRLMDEWMDRSIWKDGWIDR